MGGWGRWVGPGLWAVAIALQIVLIVRRCDGAFLYSLDDPYIHLALAENLAQGHYGVNLGEASSPSSSLLWPFLLAPFSQLSRFDLIPLLLNLLAGVWLWVGVDRIAAAALPATVRFAQAWKAVLGVSVLVLGNLFSLPLTGMEHTAHAALGVWVVYGAVRTDQDGRAPWWLWLVLVLEPWLRYEGVGILLAVCGWLAWRGARREAALTVAAGLGGLALFAGFLVSQGLDPLPLSVQVKSEAATRGIVGAVARVAFAITEYDGGGLPLIGGLLAVLLGLRARGQEAVRWLLVPAVVGLGHFAVGRYGWLGRYEIYANLFVGLGLFWGWRRAVPDGVDRVGLTGVLAGGAVLLAGFGARYLDGAIDVRDASHNIYAHHLQVHQLVADELQGPVAVHDLGRVAYRNEYYVLDLWGLASRESYQARVQAEGPEWMEILAARHEVGVAFLFPLWFPEVPEAWVHVATLVDEGRQIAVPSLRLAIYATPRSSPQLLREQLARWEAVLPPGTHLDWE